MIKDKAIQSINRANEKKKKKVNVGDPYFWQ